MKVDPVFSWISFCVENSFKEKVCVIGYYLERTVKCKTVYGKPFDEEIYSQLDKIMVDLLYDNGMSSTVGIYINKLSMRTLKADAQIYLSPSEITKPYKITAEEFFTFCTSWYNDVFLPVKEGRTEVINAVICALESLNDHTVFKRSDTVRNAIYELMTKEVESSQEFRGWAFDSKIKQKLISRLVGVCQRGIKKGLIF